MIFAPENVELILKGIKTQTRRPRKSLESSIGQNGEIVPGSGIVSCRWKWIVGKGYAVQPGRGKKAVGRILLTGIRLEQVGEISAFDAHAEGVDLWQPDMGGTVLGGEKQYIYKLNGKVFIGPTARETYLQAWKSFYKNSDFTEPVGVLTFRRA